MLAVAALGGCASVAPEGGAEAALYRDVRTFVRSHARDAWTVDRVALEAVAPGVAVSACQAGPEARRGVLAWLEERIASEEARLGGPPEVVWRRTRDLEPLEGVVELRRIRAAISAIDARSEADCPFWLPPDPGFVGTEGDADRWVLYLESRGGGGVNLRGSDVALSGDGAGRLLLGRGLGPNVTLAAGLEVGGAGRFERRDQVGGGSANEVTGVIGGALPVVLRLADAGEVVDFELAATAFLDGGQSLPPGVRAAIAWGLVTPRVGGAFSPMALFWVGWEYHPRRGDEAPFHMIGLGTRVGVDIDP
jgi:hypothetical protein